MLTVLDVHNLSSPWLSDALNQVVVKDGAFDDIAEQLLLDVEALRDRLTPASMGGSSSDSKKWSSAAFRSDATCWVTPDLCSEMKLEGLTQFVKRMIKETKPLHAALSLSAPDFSVQLAVYPPNSAGYTRHLDARRGVDTTTVSSRKITALFYLNKKCEGGELRVFCQQADASIDESLLVSGRDFVDIEPRFGRSCVFRSDLVEHAVLPCATERLALTFWLSGLTAESSFATSALSSPKAPTALCATLPPPPPKFSTHLPPLALSSTSDMHDNAGIFVSLACYRDSEMQHTIRDLFLSARIPSRVFVGVVWQGDVIKDQECFRHFYGKSSAFNGASTQVVSPESAWQGEQEERSWWASNVRLVEMPSSQAAGPCPARHLAQALWRGEEYYLQIDAHMRFRQNWDAYLIALLEDTRRGLPPGNKPVLSTYPLGYSLPNQVPLDTRATLLVPQQFGPEGMLRQVGRAVLPRAESMTEEEKGKALPCLLWAAGFSFADCSIIRDVPYDPLLPFLFFGEEASMAARLFTHGYDCFAPPEAVLYHLWSRSHRPPATQDSAEMMASKERSLQRVRRLLDVGDGLKDASYGLGARRTLSEFETLAGVNFRKAEVYPRPHAAPPAWMFADEVTLCDGGASQTDDSVSRRLAALELVRKFAGMS